MTTLIVMMPSRDPTVTSQEWQWPELPFLLLDKTGRTQREGRASLALLPRASSTVLLIAARDLLMVSTSVPPLKGPRLRQALPNVIEDHLIQDAQSCHLALDAQPLADGRQVVAAIDRGWFRFIVDGFTAAGHRNLRAVPVTRCLPQAVPEPIAAEPVADASLAVAAQPVVACVFGPAMQTAPELLVGAAPSLDAMRVNAPVELAIVRGASAEGLAVPVESVAATVAALAGDAPVTLYVLTGVPGGAPAGVTLANAHALPFETLARRALDCRFDLCQFEFVIQPWKLDRAMLRRLRVPLALVAVSIVIAVIGANVQWLMMARERDAINAQMTETLLNTFPKTTVVLDPAGQMARQLQLLRVAAGEPSRDDFLALSDGLARSLGPVPLNGIAALDYHDRRLDVTFKPGITVDAGLGQRLARNGLAGAADSSSGKWTIRSAS